MENDLEKLREHIEKIETTLRFVIDRSPIAYRKSIYKMGEDPFFSPKTAFKPHPFGIYNIDVPKDPKVLKASKDRMKKYEKMAKKRKKRSKSYIKSLGAKLQIREQFLKPLGE